MSKYNLLLFLLLLTSRNLISADEPINVTINNPPGCNCEQQLKEREEDEYRLTKHKDIYFIVGRPNTKVQVSFKYKVAGSYNLYLGYTQTMFWDTERQSLPFRDVNYNPEIFYRINFPKHTFFKAIDIGLFEHKSNGRNGAETRAWSGSYLKFHTIVRFYKWTFNWDVKTFVLYDASIDYPNWNIRDYMGFWESKIYLVNFYEKEKFVDRAEIYFSFYNGGKFSQRFSKGGQELGLKIRMGWGKVYPFLFFQLFHGYNESLLEYDKEYWAYRIGLAF